MLAGVAASMLALTGGLAAACFAKAFGVTFLGRPRSLHAEQATESPAPMIAGMLLLAGRVRGARAGARVCDAPARSTHPGAAGRPGRQRGRHRARAAGAVGDGAASGLEATSISVTAVAALLAVLAGLAWALRGWPRRAPRRLAPTWTCGMTPSSRFDYTATAFAKPLRLIFAAVYRPRRAIAKETGPSPYVIRRLGYTGEVVDLAETMIYARLKRWITATAAGHPRATAPGAFTATSPSCWSRW